MIKNSDHQNIVTKKTRLEGGSKVGNVGKSSVLGGITVLALLSLLVAFMVPLVAVSKAETLSGMVQEAQEMEEPSPLDLLQLPLHQGFILNDDYSLVFDKPEGRIIQAQIDGYGEEAVVQAFYHETLLALGWVLDNQRTEGHHAHYARDAEHLSLEYLRDEDVMMIRFYLHPIEK